MNVETQKVSDGVWYLTGGTHHSVSVEFKNHVALVECPLNDDRAVAVIEADVRPLGHYRSLAVSP